MKSHAPVLTALALSIASCASDGQSSKPDLPPAPLRDIGKKPLNRAREFQFKDYTFIGEKNTIPCKIRYIDKFFGYLEDGEYYQQGKMPFQSACYVAGSVKWLDEIPLRFDNERRQWIPDVDKRLKWEATASGQEDLDPDYKKVRRAALHAYTLNSINAQGFAYTDEDVIGEEKGRIRQIAYCLFHEEVALCGRGNVGYVSQGHRGDLTDYALQILRSIEFVLGAPPPDAPSTTPSNAAPAPKK